MNKKTGGWTNKKKNRWMDEQKTGGWTNKKKDRWIDE